MISICIHPKKNKKYTNVTPIGKDVSNEEGSYRYYFIDYTTDMQTVNKWCLISLALRIEYGGNVASFLATQEKFMALGAERCIKLYSTANTLLFATYVGFSSKKLVLF